MYYEIKKVELMQAYGIVISDASREQTLRIRKSLDLIMGLENGPTPDPKFQEVAYPAEQYTDLSTFDAHQLAALKDAAYLYYAYRGTNKINTIKHIRAITNSDLLQSKQLVDYAVMGMSYLPASWKVAK